MHILTTSIMAQLACGHIGFIMDGNRRWAAERGEGPSFGHEAGYERAKDVCDWCLDRGLRHATLYAFSSENWKRSASEVASLLGLVSRLVTEDLPHFHDKGIRLRIMGEEQGVPAPLMAAIRAAERKTARNDRANVNICFNYGGRREIVSAIRGLIREGVHADDVDEAAVRRHLYVPDASDPDLVIRTSGELRLSNFLPWQTAYSELHFTDVHWPDFSQKHLDEALERYAHRDRRYGQ